MLDKILKVVIKDKASQVLWGACFAAIGLILYLDKNTYVVNKIVELGGLNIAKAILVSLVLSLTSMINVAMVLKNLANKVNPDDYERYHPNIGVTVYRIPESSNRFDPDVWYCPHCLTVENMLSHLQAANKPDISGYHGWKCFNCNNVIKP